MRFGNKNPHEVSNKNKIALRRAVILKHAFLKSLFFKMKDTGYDKFLSQFTIFFMSKILVSYTIDLLIILDFL